MKASDNDEHYNPEKRSTYRSDVNNQNYYSVSLHAGYYITPAAKVYVEGTWNRITNKKGGTSLYFRIFILFNHCLCKIIYFYNDSYENERG